MSAFLLSRIITRTGRVQAAGILKCLRQKSTGEVARPCVPVCDHPGFTKIKRIQREFQANEGCVVWRMSPWDTLLYGITLLLSLAGFGLSVFSNLVLLNQ